MIRRCCRCSLVVNADEGHVQIEPREGKIVGIAAKECRCPLRRKGQADVAKAPVFVKSKLPPAVKTNHIASRLIVDLAVFFKLRFDGFESVVKPLACNTFRRLRHWRSAG